MTTSRPNLADVARIAGVGPATVSRALNGRPDVSEKTRERIRKIADELGFRPSATARALRRGSFRAVSAIVPDLVWGWWEPVLRSAAEAAADAGFHLFVHPIAGTEGGLEAVIEGLANVPTEGVIVVSVPDQAAARDSCERIGLPVVAIDDTSRSVQLASVSAKNRDGARTIVEHLISQGCERIACVGATSNEFTPYWGEGLFVEERVAGYRDAVTAAGLAPAEELVLDWSSPGDESIVTVPELDRLLESGAEPDAIFCLADLLAAPVLRTLSAHGLSVPDDVAVAGFDDERAALLLDPQLTTMRQPYDQMGRLAVDLLLRAISGERLPARRHELETELVLRGSTAVSLR
ncbi:LacI family DNA-binding transcriptional regulator [Saxibacter everestensis]|uniref:LacI family DNA-binding transcriptional regulator n=1 Tax=Saxibacter everestensis TaxID=2909229 RepID=A0ABY8QXY9_9MICO|nr:LacI family DNA-binding transcriptional regulator [Brevibacteriaceae bacterium ZFBP1038]